MVITFDGRKKAEEIEERLREKVKDIIKVKPQLVSIVVGDNGGALKYQKLKQKKARSLGADIEIRKFDENVSLEELKEVVGKLNSDKSVYGIMLQLPLPQSFSKEDRDMLINLIRPEKDVDGMRLDSPYTAPVVKAIMLALDEAKEATNNIVRPPFKETPYKVVVVGANGFVGTKLIKELAGKSEYEVISAGSDSHDLKSIIDSADVVISATGVADLIKEDMVKDGVILIDVGAPVGDIDKKAYEKASFVSPVPGGVGPLTIVCLMENLILGA